MNETLFCFCFHFYFTTNRGPFIHEKKIKSQSSSSRLIFSTTYFYYRFYNKKTCILGILHRIFASVNAHCDGLISSSNAPILTIFFDNWSSRLNLYGWLCSYTFFYISKMGLWALIPTLLRTLSVRCYNRIVGCSVSQSGTLLVELLGPHSIWYAYDYT